MKLLMLVFTGLHAKILKTLGWFGSGSDDGSLLVLEHTGAKSGKVRETPLVFINHNGGHVVCASVAGAPRNPGWYYNLKAHPDTEITVDRRTISVRARELDGAEREDVWNRLTTSDDRWEEYAGRTERTLPLIALEPT